MIRSRRTSRRSFKARIPRQGNFHMSLPSMLKLRLTATDSNVHGLGLGGWGAVNTAGLYNATGGSAFPAGLAPTYVLTLYDLSRPSAELFCPPTADGTIVTPDQVKSAAWMAKQAAGTALTAPDYYAYHMPGFVNTVLQTPTSTVVQTPIATPNTHPGQLNSFANLFKYAVIERVDFVFKYTNLGTAPLYGQTDSSSSASLSLAGSNLLHTCMPLPRAQLDTLKLSWRASSRASNTNAVHLSEFPGCSTIITAQDGTKETGLIRKSFDLAQITGDTVRKDSWATSSETTTPTWTWPSPPSIEPQLCMIATSPLIDSRLASTGYPDSLTAGNVLLRFNEHVQVHYHVTFWQPKSPTFSIIP